MLPIFKIQTIMKLKTLAIAAVALAMGMTATSCGNSGKGGEAVEQTAAANDQNTPGIETAVTDEQIEPASDRLVCYDFNATWCVPCKKFAPAFELAEKRLGDKAQFISVDIDKEPELAEKFNITSVPTVILVKTDGTQVRYEGIGEILPAERFIKIVEDNL